MGLVGGVFVVCCFCVVGVGGDRAGVSVLVSVVGCALLYFCGSCGGGRGGGGVGGGGGEKRVVGGQQWGVDRE
ncbi:UNVERIFIED_CONTAM: hypothetical protein DV095_10600 [Bifidobacterium breve]|nr:hypothetical protein [Bifidobacterium breve]